MFVVPVAPAFKVTTNDPDPGTTFFNREVASAVPTVTKTRLAVVTSEFVTVTVVPTAAMLHRPDGVFEV